MMRSVSAETTRTICQARLRSGAPCRQIVPRGGDSDEFCPTRQKQLAEGVSAEALRAGKQPGGQRHRPPKAAARLVRAESKADVPETNGRPPVESDSAQGGLADPKQLRPGLATAASRNAALLEKTLLEAAVAERTVWASITCRFCDREARYPVSVADHKVRVDAVRALLAEALGAPARAEETPAVSMPTNAPAISKMGWGQMQSLAATIFADQIAAVMRGDGNAAVRERLAGLSDGQRRYLLDCLTEQA